MVRFSAFGESFNVGFPFVIFLPADFKSNTMVYKNMNSQFDLRGKLKEKFRYFGDIYEFNSRTCDCLFIKIKNNGYIHRVFTVIYKPTFKDETKMENVINGLKRLKEEMYKNDIYDVALNPECLFDNQDDYDKFLGYVSDIFIEPIWRVVIT